MTYNKRNFESIGKLILPLVERHCSASIMNYSKLFNIWETLVGENISKKAQPIRLKTIKSGDQNILYVGMTGPYMAELSLQTQDIKEKINSYFSKEVIAQIKLQRMHDVVGRNVVELNKLQNFLIMKNEVPMEPETDIVELEHALTKMKKNFLIQGKKMRLPQTKKHWMSSFLVLFLIFIAGLGFAADHSKVESKYIEMSKGDDNAPVVFVEYASLTCPACAAFHANVYPRLNKEYIETGKIKFIHREIYFDRVGLWAALTARCTNSLNRYFGMLDLLYSEQPTWSRSDSSDKIINALLKISAKSGIEKEKVISCLEDQEKALDLVNQYQIYVNEDAIESTPTFVINKKKYTNRSYEEIKEIIEKELKN